MAEDLLKLYLKVLTSLLILMLLFEGIVAAFHLLNLPSDLAVLEGVCLLMLLSVGGWMAFRVLWRHL